ncbi:hypothetical protein SZ64_16390 [Erythrobacter sp. SG61-1L]|uniref:hypothetical protein n=1 Tax=Erythrobacter sp. SG61-1L TaxID=1603897 RepID=UPI0006C904D1|nr:hypothetical protein [Erythrobacter sp. SG61-1L]KPL69531.1 hypothetical protein SZ64_16390 [Erythrobacter sp. SG61-1L]
MPCGSGKRGLDTAAGEPVIRPDSTLFRTTPFSAARIGSPHDAPALPAQTTILPQAFICQKGGNQHAGRAFKVQHKCGAFNEVG